MSPLQGVTPQTPSHWPPAGMSLCSGTNHPHRLFLQGLVAAKHRPAHDAEREVESCEPSLEAGSMLDLELEGPTGFSTTAPLCNQTFLNLSFSHCSLPHSC